MDMNTVHQYLIDNGFTQVNDEVYSYDGNTYQVSNYLVKWTDSEGNCDDTLYFGSNYEYAIQELNDGGEQTSKHTSYYAFMSVLMQPVIFDTEYDMYCEEGEEISVNEIAACDGYADKAFEPREAKANELEIYTSMNLGNAIAKAIGCEYVCTYGGGKYGELRRNDGEDVIVLRVADHAYNPRNNDGDKKFISVEICEVNATAVKYCGRNSMQYTGSDTYEQIYADVLERVEELFELV
jgi:hypothetical protein